MPPIEGYRRVKLAYVYVDLAGMLDDYHGASALCERLRCARPSIDRTDSEIVFEAKQLLSEVDVQLAPFDRDNRLYRVLRRRDELESLSKLWDVHRGLATKIEEVRSVVGELYGCLEPAGHRNGLAINSYATEAGRATALADYLIQLLANALEYPRLVDTKAVENISEQLHELSDHAERLVTRSDERKLIPKLLKVTDELEVLSLLEHTDTEVAL